MVSVTQVKQPAAAALAAGRAPLASNDALVLSGVTRSIDGRMSRDSVCESTSIGNHTIAPKHTLASSTIGTALCLTETFLVMS